MGVIDEVGKAVVSIKKADWVVFPFNIGCGYCLNCHRGNTHAGLTMNPEGAWLAYGYAGMGRYIAPDPGAENEDASNGICPFHVAEVLEKALMLGTGQAPVKRYNQYLRGVIVNGRAKPSRIVSHHIRIDEA